ncbi:hypothetical protein POM88_024958 [Heracleum sosnowskyi]|uniref:Uncharacterized protein n=1 Tax=Heracleum sosnowskyi TaxID=360622 RepID=A0AAD8MMQ6_9APIA|nr:hypothetical protein POM88_024958 [Heracleum sosnowskyi]
MIYFGNKKYSSWKETLCQNQLCFIRKFDMSDKVWVPLKSLSCDRALFVSRNSFCISTVGEEAKKSGVLANNIYGLNCEGRTLHSLDNGKLINITNGLEISKWVTGENYGKLSFWFEPLHHLVSKCSEHVLPKEERKVTAFTNMILKEVLKASVLSLKSVGYFLVRCCVNVVSKLVFPKPKRDEPLFSKEFVNFVAYCLEKDPQRRPSSLVLLDHQFFREAVSELVSDLS